MPVDGSGFALHAWADEAVHADDPTAYLLAATVCDPATCADIESRLRLLLIGRRFRLHWKEETRRRNQLVEAVAALDVAHVVVIGTPMSSRRQERARRQCLERLLAHLSEAHVTTLTLESRGAPGDKRDLETVVQTTGRRAMSPSLRVRHGRPRDEPMLWLPDIVAGVYRLAVLGQAEPWVKALQPVDEIRVDLR